MNSDQIRKLAEEAGFCMHTPGELHAPWVEGTDLTEEIAKLVHLAMAAERDRVKPAIVQVLNSHTREMENYGYYGSNPGVSQDDYDEVADEVVVILARGKTDPDGYTQEEEMHNPNPHCSACKDMHDGFFGSWASPCTVHNEDGSLKAPTTPGRIIRIESCKDCPNWDHKGGFGSPAYVPRCNKTRPSRELPYTKSVGGNRIIATQTPGIPDWCPLETA